MEPINNNLINPSSPLNTPLPLPPISQNIPYPIQGNMQIPLPPQPNTIPIPSQNMPLPPTYMPQYNTPQGYIPVPKKKRKTCFVILLSSCFGVIIIIIIVAFIVYFTGNVAFNLVKYSNSDYKYSVSYPKDWKINDSDPSSVNFTGKSNSEDSLIEGVYSGGSLGLLLLPQSTATSLKDVSDKIYKVIASNFSSQQMLSQSETTLNGKKAYKIVTSFKLANNTGSINKTLTLYIVQSSDTGALYVIYFGGSDYQLKPYKSGLDNIFNTFEIN